MPASRLDEIFLLRQSVWKTQDIKIGRTSYGPRNTTCGGSSKVGCVIGCQGAEMKEPVGRKNVLQHVAKWLNVGAPSRTIPLAIR